MMATNSAYASYQEIVDISTTPNKVGIFGIHTPDTTKPIQMLNGFYRQFRQVKYLGCDVKVQPAATLPMDPLGVSYEAGEVATDPRDLLNPIMVKGAHGETLNQALDVAYRDNQNLGDVLTKSEYNLDPTDSQSVIYYSALSDPSFKKFGVLQPFRLGNLHPMVHKVVGTMPIYPKQTEVGPSANLSELGSDTALNEDSSFAYSERAKYGNYGPAFDYEVDDESMNIPAGIGTYLKAGTSDYQLLNGQFFTQSMERLGWIDTISRPQTNMYNSISALSMGNEPIQFDNPGFFDDLKGNYSYRFNTIPRLFMSVMVMPPCYKSILTFRMVINHKFAFRGFTSTVNRNTTLDTEAYASDLADVATTSAVNALQDLSIPESTSVETINGDSSTVTEGVF